MATRTKKELIERIAGQTNQNRAQVKKTVQAFLDTVIDELSNGNRLELRDFGVFEIRERRPRMAQNPKTLERVEVPAKKTVKFKVGRLMKAGIAEDEAEASNSTDLTSHPRASHPRTGPARKAPARTTSREGGASRG